MLTISVNSNQQKVTKKSLSLTLFAGLAAVSTLVSCKVAPEAKQASASESTDPSANPSATPTSPPTTAGTLAIGDNPLASSYPDGLAFSAFPSGGVGDTAAVTAGQIAVATGLNLLVIDTACAPHATTSTNGCIVECKHNAVAGCASSPNFANPPGHRPICPPSGTPNPPPNCVLAYTPPPTGSGGGGGGASTGGQCLVANSPGITWPSGRQNFDSYAHYKSLNPSTTTIARETAGTTLDQPAATKVLHARARLKGEGECFSDRLKHAMARLVKNRDDLDGTTADCYQPDWGVNAKNQGTDAQAEACLVGFGREQIAETTAYIDFGTGLMEALLCQAKKNGASDSLPEVGKEKDFLGVLKTATSSDSSLAITAANMKRVEDVAGRPVFSTTIGFTKTVKLGSAGLITAPVKFTVMLSHSPSTDNFGYDGTLSIQHQAAILAGNSACTSASKVASIKYSRSGNSSDPVLKFEYRSGSFEGTASSYFDSSGLVNFNVFDAARGGANVSGAKIGRVNYVTFDGNPLSGAGKLAYWVNFGQAADEQARGFMFEIEEQDKTLKGCGVAGAAAHNAAYKSIRAAIYADAELEPGGNFRPFLLNNQSEQHKIWKQCFKQEGGLYVVDLDKTTDDAKGYDFIPGTENPIQPPAVDRNKPLIGNQPPPPPQ